MTRYWALRRQLEEKDAAEVTFQTAINCGEGRELPVSIVKLGRHTIVHKAVYPSELLGRYAGWKMGNISDLFEWAAGVQDYMTEEQGRFSVTSSEDGDE